MKYIRIKNNGLIEPEALHLVGASTKINDSSKIGQFGSGNKYAMAYLLRNNYDLKVFSGEKEIKITTEDVSFRDNTYQVVFIDGEKTSITTQMGKDWEFWQALREIYCNAIDEGNSSLDFVQTIEPKEGETHFYIDTKKDVVEFVTKFDNYFAENKEVLFECDKGRILKKGDAETKANIYRKAIRCYDSTQDSLFDYDFNEIAIDENRIVKYSWNVQEKMWDLLYRCTDKEVILQVLHNCANTDFIESYISDFSSINSSNISQEFKECLKEIRLCPKSYGGLLKPDEAHNHVIVPTQVFESVRGYIGDENVGKAFRVGRDGAIWRPIERTELHDATLEKAMDFFKEVEFDEPLDYDIVVGMFDNKDVLGFADTTENKIVLSDICMERGVNEVVNTIIEEFIHLKYQVGDETRGFQTSIIAEFISYMKKRSAYLI